MLTDEQVATYRRDGYIVVADVLEADELAELRRVTDETVSGASAVAASDSLYDLEDSHTPAAPRVRRIKLPHQHHPFYAGVTRHPRLLGLLAPLIGPDIRLHGGKLNMKSAEFGAPVEWHQDWAFYPHTNDDVLAVGIMLDDVDEDNGPLLVLPGSHTGPTHDHHVGGVFAGAIDPRAADLDLSAAVALTGRAGSVTIHHARAVHGSALNTSARQRRLLLYEYAAADAWPLLGCGDFDAFNAAVVAGRPTIEPRLSPAPVRMPLPASGERRGSIYETQKLAERRHFAAYQAAGR